MPNKYDLTFTALCISVVITFFAIRPIRSPWHKFIAGDGLGYYAYLPAKFIHGDPKYDFKWFNKVYNANYVYSSFENPEDNLLVNYKEHKINKYYQGLSYIWFPFFVGAHITAKLVHYPADGFSDPYQYFIGLASLVYLFLGLYYLRKLLNSIYSNAWIGVLVPFMLFYGTHLFNYAIFANSLSHVYSFSFIVLFLYFGYQAFNSLNNAPNNALWCLLFLVITVCIRPLNGLVLLVLPAFIPAKFNFKSVLPQKMQWIHVLILGILFGALYNQLSISYIQTGGFLPYTYTNEHFNFTHNKFFDALLSYHMGLFVYVPLVLLSLIGAAYLPLKQSLILLVFFFGMCFIYSSWWYWPIVKRAMVDYYAIPAVFLGACLQRFKSLLFAGVTLITIGYYQFKDMQVRRGILSEFGTYAEVFWRNFLRTDKANQYFIPPSTILKSEKHTEDFESFGHKANQSTEQVANGNYSLKIGARNYLYTYTGFAYPSIFAGRDFKKIRLSFKCYFTENVHSTHIFIQFFNKENKSILDVPFYLNKEDILNGKWDYKQFGYEITDTTQLNARTVDHVGFSIWNVEAKDALYIDDVSMEFILTDLSFETIIN